MSDIGPDYWLTTNYAAQLDDLSVEQHGIVKELVRAVWREARCDLEAALSVSDDSIDAIRSMLRAGGVPEAPFIDDHVRNVIVQRNNARSDALEEAAKVAHRISASARSFGGEETAEMIELEIRDLKERAKP